jgi:hypothetical protein
MSLSLCVCVRARVCVCTVAAFGGKDVDRFGRTSAVAYLVPLCARLRACADVRLSAKVRWSVRVRVFTCACLCSFVRASKHACVHRVMRARV